MSATSKPLPPLRFICPRCGYANLTAEPEGTAVTCWQCHGRTAVREPAPATEADWLGCDDPHLLCRFARWFLGEPRLAPRTISIGGRLGYDDAGNTPNTQIVYFEYPNAPLVFETRGLPRAKGDRQMDRLRGAQIGVIVQCERGHVLVPNYTSATAYDRQGQQVQHWEIRDDSLGNHIRNFLAAVAANDPSRLNADVHEGHLSSSLCHLGGISQRLGKPAPSGEIMEQLKGNDLLSGSFDRMASHLRANGVDIDRRESRLALGPWLELDPATEEFVGNDAATALRSRQQRDGFTVPDLERNAVAKTS